MAKGEKKRSQPRLWRNSFMWVAAALLVLAVLGLIRGDDFIRDPGQTREPFLAVMYLAGSVLMAANGWLTHRFAMREWREWSDDQESA